MQYFSSTQITIINKDPNQIEGLKTELPDKYTNHFSRVCKCHGHNPKCSDRCFCICSCPPLCTKYCHKRDSGKSEQTKSSVIDEDILNKYNQLIDEVDMLENKLLDDLKNHKISIDEFHQKYDKIRKIKDLMPK